MTPSAHDSLSRVVDVVLELSGLDLSELGADTTFLEMGLDSLVLTQVSQALTREFGVRVSFRELVRDLDTPGAVAAHMTRTLGAEAASQAVPAPIVSVQASPESAGSTSLEPRMALTQSATQRAGMVGLFEQQVRIMAEQLRMLGGDASAPSREGAAAPAVVEAAAPAKTESAEAPVTLAPGAAPLTVRSTKSHAITLTPHQRRHLDSLVQRYSARTAGSKRLADEYRMAHADPRTASGFQALWKEMVYPLVTQRSSGARLWDVDGNEYIDLLNGFGPNFLGHGSTLVRDAVVAQLDAGWEVGPQSPLAGEAASLICELTGMERASFVCTGSEAVQAALRAARTHTGRDTVATFSRDYHGNFDEVLVRAGTPGGRRRTLPSAPGIPFRAVEDIEVLDYGTDASLVRIRELAPTLAAILVEPVQSRRPDFQPRQFLLELRRIATEHGVVLIFDEVVTGFRIHQGGAQAFYKIEADLATYGKVVGGGLPIGVVAGRRPFMDVFDGGPWQFGDDSRPQSGVTFFAGTFVRHPLALAATLATLRYLKAQGPQLQADLNRRGDRFALDVQRVLDETGLPMSYANCGSVMYLKGDTDNPLHGLFHYFMRLSGVHILEGFPSYLTLAHDDADLATCVDVFRRSAEAMLEAGFAGARAPDTVVTAVPATSHLPGARLGRDRDGRPRWFAPDPADPSRFVAVP